MVSPPVSPFEVENGSSNKPNRRLLGIERALIAITVTFPEQGADRALTQLHPVVIDVPERFDDMVRVTTTQCATDRPPRGVTPVHIASL